MVISFTKVENLCCRSIKNQKTFLPIHKQKQSVCHQFTSTHTKNITNTAHSTKVTKLSTI